MSVIIRKGGQPTQQIKAAFGGIAALLLLLGPATARGDQLDVGKRLYHELDYEAARVALLRGATSRDPHRRAETYLYLGLIDTVEGDDRDARASFRSGLVLDPQLQLPLGTSPKVARIFDAVKAELAKANAEEHPAPSPPVPPAPVSPPLPQRVITVRRIEPAAPAPDGAAPAATEGPSHGGRWAGGVLLVLGLAAEGVAIYAATQEQAAEKSFHSSRWQTDAVTYQSNANQAALLANVLYASGGVVGITGISLFFAF